MYGVKLKGVSVCFAMLKAVLSGNYVNFGVFRLYGDDALDNALQTFIKLLLSIPHSDLLVGPRSPSLTWFIKVLEKSNSEGLRSRKRFFEICFQSPPVRVFFHPPFLLKIFLLPFLFSFPHLVSQPPSFPPSSLVVPRFCA